jgi:hypothetical protein
MLTYSMQHQVFQGNPIAAAFTLPGSSMAYAYTGENDWFGVGYLSDTPQGYPVPLDESDDESQATVVPGWLSLNGTQQTSRAVR